MLKFGIVHKLDGMKRIVRFPGDDDMLSKALPVLQQHVGSIESLSLPQVNDQVVCLMDDYCEDGVILGGIYNESRGAPYFNSEHQEGVKFSNGSIVMYDKNTKDMTVSVEGGGDLLLSVYGGGKVIIDGELRVSGDIVSLQDVKANGNVKAGEAVPATHVTLLGHIHVETSVNTNAPTPGL